DRAGLSPPTAKELAEKLGQRLDSLIPVLTVCVEDGLLVDIGEGLYYPPAALEQAGSGCQATLARAGSAALSQLREAWKITRKFSVPLCEWFDAQKLTIREGDLRRAGPKLGTPIS